MSAAAPVTARKHPWYSWRRIGFNFLTLSLAIHVLLGLGAAYFVVSVTYPKKKSFAGGAPAQSASQHSIEHKVSMAKAQQRSSAPAALTRVTTTGASKVALPSMPTAPTDSAMTPVSMSGMGGQGLGALGTLGGGSIAGGGGPAFFGVRSAGISAGLVGSFYDFKQTPDRQPTGMTPEIYGQKVVEYARANFNDTYLSHYYKASRPVYADRIFTPYIPAVLGPAAFGVEKEVQPKMWLVHYKGNVVAPEKGTFYFVGLGDDVMMVRFNNQLVLDSCWGISTGLKGQVPYKYGPSMLYQNKPFQRGLPIHVSEGQTYPIEVIIGEQPGGWSSANLMLEKEGVSYEKDPATGSPLLPLFRMSASNAPLPKPPPNSQGYVVHAEGGPVWKTQAAITDFSVFNH